MRSVHINVAHLIASHLILWKRSRIQCSNVQHWCGSPIHGRRWPQTGRQRCSGKLRGRRPSVEIQGAYRAALKLPSSLNSNINSVREQRRNYTETSVAQRKARDGSRLVQPIIGPIEGRLNWCKKVTKRRIGDRYPLLRCPMKATFEGAPLLWPFGRFPFSSILCCILSHS